MASQVKPELRLPALHLIVGENLFRLHGENSAGGKWAVDLTPFVTSFDVHMAAGEISTCDLSLVVSSVNRPEGEAE